MLTNSVPSRPTVEQTRFCWPNVWQPVRHRSRRLLGSKSILPRKVIQCYKSSPNHLWTIRSHSEPSLNGSGPFRTASNYPKPFGAILNSLRFIRKRLWQCSDNLDDYLSLATIHRALWLTKEHCRTLSKRDCSAILLAKPKLFNSIREGILMDNALQLRHLHHF